ncbi:MAG: hypothetical protein GF411_13005, partial [Candidatus Lokiarchaeota archaeon]|nr:hypothetical protein [Candidatus Lokiarchaeota archaeon]
MVRLLKMILSFLVSTLCIAGSSTVRGEAVKRIIPILLLVLILCSPMPSQNTLDSVLQPDVKFSTSADGDTSPDSLSIFSETSDDDTMTVIDSFHNTTIDFADADDIVAGSAVADYEETFVVDGVGGGVDDTSGGPVNYSLIWNTPSGMNLDGFTIALYIKSYGSETFDVASDTTLWNSDTGVFDDYGNIPENSYDWVNYTTYDSSHWNSSYVTMQLYAEDADNILVSLLVDYAEITWYYTTAHISEPFSDVSDWNIEPYFGGLTITTDGDVATFVSEGDGNWNAYAWNTTGESLEGKYIEFRARCNDSSNDNWGVVLKDADGYQGTTIDAEYYYFSDTDWHTHKYYIEHDEVVESIGFILRGTPNPFQIEIDYLNILDPDEAGFQHDGSTTGGVSEWHGEDWSVYYPLDENTGTRAYDSSDNSNDADLTGSSTWVSGKIGTSAVRLYAGGDEIRFDNDVAFTDNQAHTVSCWMKWDVASPSSFVIPMGTGSTTGNWYFRQGGDWRVAFRPQGESSTILSDVTSEDWFDGNWFHFSATVTTDHYVTVYIDGAQVGSTTEVTNSHIVYSNFGQGYSGTNYGWNGTIDEPMLFSRVLDADEIQALYNYGSGSVSSDGDELSLAAGSGGSTFSIATDTTATHASLDTSYYPFLSVDFNDGDSSDYVMLEGYNGAGGVSTILSNQTVGTSELYCAPAAVLDEYESIRIYVNPSATVRMRWVKAFSIANFTLSQGNCESTDYLYVQNSVLYCSGLQNTNEYIRLDHDPSVSVSDTYSVYNITTDATDDSAEFYFTMYAGSWGTASDNYRGPTDSGNITDFRLQFQGNPSAASTRYISVVSFIEDSTAPSVVRSFANPPEPEDDETVTLSAVITDTLEVYKVYFDAIVSPSGFSDTAYYATEQSDNLWTYSFSEMTNGYYCFKIVASDGANENSLTEYAYVSMTVRESSITIQDISFFGVGEDFTMMTYSFSINKDCTYVINEASDNNPASDTHSGSVSAGRVNLAWDKLTTTDSLVNFTVTFTNGTLTETVDGQYQVAQTTLSISERMLQLSEDYVTLSGQCNKDSVSWTLYLDGSSTDSGTVNTGSFLIDWTRTSSTSPSQVNYSVKFTDSITTVWINNTYDEYNAESFDIIAFHTDTAGQYVSVYVDTTWENATVYLYQDDDLKTSGAEGTTLIYAKSTSAGYYNVSVLVDGGDSDKWINISYQVAAEDSLIIESIEFDATGDFVSAFCHTNWGNTTQTLYESTTGTPPPNSWTEKSSESEGEAVRYAKSTAVGYYYVALRVNGGAEEVYLWFSYTIEATTFSINSLYFRIGNTVVSADVHTTWENATISLYENDVVQDSENENTTISYTKSTGAGTYNVALLIDAGSEIHWINDSYTVSVTEITVETVTLFGASDDFDYMQWSFELNL